MIYLCTDADSLTAKDATLLTSFLSDERKKKLEKKQKDKKAALLCYALAGLMLRTPGLRFDATISGQPILPDFPDLHISLSHTPGAALVGISDSPLGVDIERTSRAVSDAVFSRLATPSEASFSEKKERIALWTLKESYLKYKGTGIASSLSSVSFSSLYPPVCSDPKVVAFTGELAGYTYALTAAKCQRIFTLSAKEAVNLVKKY